MLPMYQDVIVTLEMSLRAVVQNAPVGFFIGAVCTSAFMSNLNAFKHIP
jgi:hypothetical protein